MKTFVVALYNNFDSTIVMSIVPAESKAKALEQVVAEEGFEPEPDCSEDYYKQLAFDGDHSIEALEI